MTSRRLLAFSVALALAFASLSLVPLSAQAKGSLLGKPCKQQGLRFQQGKTVFVCVKRKGKLVWAVDKSGGGGGGSGVDVSKLPLITTFDSGGANQSAQLPADMSVVDQTTPYLGKNTTIESPHTGIHVNFTDADGRYTSTGGAANASAYPAIYAVADGIVSHVDISYANGNTDKSQIDLAFARTPSGQEVDMGYSIEPMVKEPSAGFYSSFIKVTAGQQVHKGDVLAYIYVPPTSTGETHLHMQISVLAGGSMQFQAPAIFTSDAVAQFAAKFGDRGGIVGGVPLAPCMGVWLDATENPFGTGAVNNLDCSPL